MVRCLLAAGCSARRNKAGGYAIDFNDRGAADVAAPLEVPPMAPDILGQFDGVQATA